MKSREDMQRAGISGTRVMKNNVPGVLCSQTARGYRNHVAFKIS